MKKFEKIEKIGYHSNFDFECNTERGFKESLSIALGFIEYFIKMQPSISLSSNGFVVNAL